MLGVPDGVIKGYVSLIICVKKNPNIEIYLQEYAILRPSAAPHPAIGSSDCSHEIELLPRLPGGVS
jgi:hypothetical protein